jgi:membrane protein implicated in regulation of membrane protease activity
LFNTVNCLGFISDLGDQDSLSLRLFWGIGFFGLVFIILQAIFGLAVGGHDGDTGSAASIDAHGGHGSGAGYLSIRTISAMMLGFGFGGALLERNGFPIWIAALGGIGIGFLIGAVYVVLMRSLYRLRSDGTSVLSDAVNQSGTVYLRIPGLLSGAGEIQVAFGGRLQNVKAFTDGPELPTGTTVRVVSLHGGQALLVEKFR